MTDWFFRVEPRRRGTAYAGAVAPSASRNGRTQRQNILIFDICAKRRSLTDTVLSAAVCGERRFPKVY